MTKMRNILIGTALGAMGLLAAGCAANAKPAAPSSTQAIRCTKCEVTWVKDQRKDTKGHTVGYASKKSMVCPDCKDAVENFFAGGKFQHTCKTCGDTMEMCDTHM
ncbi:MAG TPA: hypothetical protein VIL86_05155 [Tepidisphaeraceae bacterium]|jgi:hypothetical protein